MTRLKKRKYPPMLEELIPDPQVCTDYINRKIHGHEDFQMLDYARMEGLNMIFEGPTGAGKTMLARAYASARQIPFLSLNPGSAAEPTMLFGKDRLKADGQHWVDGIVTAACRFGDCVLDLDEVNFMPHGVTANLHSLTDSQRYIVLYDRVMEYTDDEGEVYGLPEVVRAAKGLLVMAAYNDGYRGTEELNEAFRNRFDIPVDWGYDETVEEDLVASTTLRNIAREIRRMNQSGEIETPCSTNRLQFFERMVEDIGLDSAIANFLAHFEKSERDAIKNVFDLNRDRLWNDYEKANNRDPNKGYFVTPDQ
jgi:MoxR-like ATPase